MFDRVLIGSGPTIEPIDPVRFISNRSSGKTGLHLAEEAKRRGTAEVVFVTGPTAFLPGGVTLVEVETAQEMRREMRRFAAGAAVVIMAAAVCDFRSAKYYPDKIKKTRERMQLDLVRNPDILRELGAVKPSGQILVGFAAETEDIFENASRKLRDKNLDLLVLNEISVQNPVFGCDENQAYLVSAEGVRRMEKMSKALLAERIWDAVALIAGGAAGG